MDVLPSTRVSQSRSSHLPSPRVAGALLLAGLAGLVAFAAACSGDLPGNVVIGSGEPTTEVRQVADFVEVEASGGVALEVSTGAAVGVSVTAQPNLLPLTTTTVDGSRLTVATTRGFTTTRGITVAVTAPRLTVIALSGGSSATGDLSDAESLSLDLSGGARVTLIGTVDDLEVAGDGGAVIELGGLRANTARVDLSGGVVATLAVSSSVTGTASGGVVINLEQRPGTVDVETSGGAVVGP